MSEKNHAVNQRPPPPNRYDETCHKVDWFAGKLAEVEPAAKEIHPTFAGLYQSDEQVRPKVNRFTQKPDKLVLVANGFRNEPIQFGRERGGCAIPPNAMKPQANVVATEDKQFVEI